jgi:diguanylate cyclase (GGDEF)-like protein
MPDLEETRRQLQQLRDEYSSRLAQRIDEIEAGLEALASPDCSHDDLQHVFRDIHKLSGSAGTFGFSQLTKQTRYMEVLLKECLDNGTIPETRIISLLLDLADQLRELIGSGPEGELPGLNTEPPAALVVLEADAKLKVYIVEDDPDQGNELAIQLSHFGYDASLFADATQAAAAMESLRPDILILDMMLPEGDLAGADLANGVKQILTNPPPTIFVSSRTDWESRLASVRAGGVAYIEKPLDISVLLDQMERLTRTEQQEPYRVLVVDDEVELGQHYTLVLGQAGMDVKCITSPDKILDILESFGPELIIMDLYLEESTGAEVAQVIRQHKSYFSLSIVFLSSEANLDVQLQTLEQGDDFLQKPISDVHLVSAVRTRVERARTLGRLMYHDSLTGVLNHITLKLHLETELARCQRHGQELCYVMLDIDKFKDVNDSMGHQTGDRVLKSLAHLLHERLRKTDQLGRYGGDEIGVILPHTDLETAYELIDELRLRFSQLQHLGKESEFSLTLSAGIAASRNCRESDRLIAEADEALYQAKTGGRNRVCVYRAEKGD